MYYIPGYVVAILLFNFRFVQSVTYLLTYFLTFLLTYILTSFIDLPNPENIGILYCGAIQSGAAINDLFSEIVFGPGINCNLKSLSVPRLNLLFKPISE